MLENSTTSTQLTVSWGEPDDPKGIIELYSIHIKQLEFLYDNPDFCNTHNDDTEFMRNITEQSITFKGALPFSNYSVIIQAFNGDEGGEEKVVYLQTLEGNNSFF